jgi:hypothetical protein
VQPREPKCGAGINWAKGHYTRAGHEFCCPPPVI